MWLSSYFFTYVRGSFYISSCLSFFYICVNLSVQTHNILQICLQEPYIHRYKHADKIKNKKIQIQTQHKRKFRSWEIIEWSCPLSNILFESPEMTSRLGGAKEEPIFIRYSISYFCVHYWILNSFNLERDLEKSFN